jgi:hypothetical protein
MTEHVAEVTTSHNKTNETEFADSFCKKEGVDRKHS